MPYPYQTVEEMLGGALAQTPWMSQRPAPVLPTPQPAPPVDVQAQIAAAAQRQAQMNAIGQQDAKSRMMMNIGLGLMQGRPAGTSVASQVSNAVNTGIQGYDRQQAQNQAELLRQIQLENEQRKMQLAERADLRDQGRLDIERERALAGIESTYADTAGKNIANAEKVAEFRDKVQLVNIERQRAEIKLRTEKNADKVAEILQPFNEAMAGLKAAAGQDPKFQEIVRKAEYATASMPALNAALTQGKTAEAYAGAADKRADAESTRALIEPRKDLLTAQAGHLREPSIGGRGGGPTGGLATLKEWEALWEAANPQDKAKGETDTAYARRKLDGLQKATRQRTESSAYLDLVGKVGHEDAVKAILTARKIDAGELDVGELGNTGKVGATPAAQPAEKEWTRDEIRAFGDAKVEGESPKTTAGRIANQKYFDDLQKYFEALKAAKASGGPMPVKPVRPPTMTQEEENNFLIPNAKYRPNVVDINLGQ